MFLLDGAASFHSTFRVHEAELLIHAVDERESSSEGIILFATATAAGLPSFFSGEAAEFVFRAFREADIRVSERREFFFRAFRVSLGRAVAHDAVVSA